MVGEYGPWLLHVTFGGSGGIMTGVALPMLYSPGLFVCKSRGRDFSKGEVMSRIEARFISISNQSCCRASFYSDAV